MTDQIEREYTRLKKALDACPDPDLIDVAVVSALKSADVRDILGPIVADGALLVGVSRVADLPSFGLIGLLFETSWPPDVSHITRPSCVAALMEVSPPKVLKVIETADAQFPESHAFLPDGPLPVALRGHMWPSREHVRNFMRSEAEKAGTWMQRQGTTPTVRKNDNPPPQWGRPVNTHPMNSIEGDDIYGGTWALQGTYCTSALCFERTQDTFVRID